MTSRRWGLALAALLVAAPLLWAALRRAREREETWELVRAAATAHERTGYAGRAAWRDATWGREVDVEHDAESGLTRYRFGRYSYVRQAPSSRAPDPAAWCVDLEALEKNYQPREGSPVRFLGRRARTVTLEPRHAGRPRLDLLIDEATFLPLRVTWLRPDGELYRVAAFREVEIGPRRVERRAGRRRDDWLGRRVDPAHIDEEAGFAVLQPAYLPAGFRSVDCRVKEWAGTKVRLVYSDGATVFELSQEPLLTPAQMETALVRRLGQRRAQREMRWILRRGVRAIVQSGRGGEDGERGIAVRRRRGGCYRTYELRVADRDVTLTSRADLDPEETLKVLRSLRNP